MGSGIALIVGLGNPGAQYAETRHNAGFRFLEHVAHTHGVALRTEGRFQGEVGRGAIAGREVWLLKPLTYMNRSGAAVAAFARYYKLAPGEILVAHDEVDLPPGAVRLKLGGGTAGHNGLADTLAALGSPDFVRLRIGVGHPGTSREVVRYVLARPPAAEQEAIDAAIARALACLPDIVRGEYQRVMNVLHTKQAT